MSSDGLMGNEEVRALLRFAVECTDAEQTEAALWSGSWALTRFANSTIHQNMASRNAVLHVRAVFGKRVASGSTNRTDEEGVRALVRDVVGMARVTDENPDFVSLPEPSDAHANVNSWYEDTAKATPDDRAAAVHAVIDEASKRQGSAAGSFATRAYEQGVMNSLGIDSYYRGTAASLVTVVTGPQGGFGYASAAAGSTGGIDSRAVGEEASVRAFDSRNPRDVEPGEYECVLLPYAVGDMLGMLHYMAFRALAYQEGRSFVCGRIGERIVSESVSIWDDGLDGRTLPAPFDAEGVPKQRVDLIRNGVAAGVLYDSYTAHRERRRSTGHALGGESELTGQWTHLIMAPGQSDVDEMIASTRRGILVTRFHYTNVAHLMTASFTGMTRDGTFLIEDGRIAGPVKNLRFTQSIPEALSGVEMVGRELKLEHGALVPALKLRSFHFSSATEF